MIRRFTYRGKEFPLYLNGTGLFNCYQKFGRDKSLVELIEPMDRESYEATLWILCELSKQGTAYCRYLGEEAERALNFAEMMLAVTPEEYLAIKEAVSLAIYDGFHREKPGEDQSDPWLAEFEAETQKKKKSRKPSIFSRLWRWVFPFVTE